MAEVVEKDVSRRGGGGKKKGGGLSSKGFILKWARRGEKVEKEGEGRNTKKLGLGSRPEFFGNHSSRGKKRRLAVEIMKAAFCVVSLVLMCGKGPGLGSSVVRRKESCIPWGRKVSF